MKRIALTLALLSCTAYAAGPPAPYLPTPHMVFDGNMLQVTLQPTMYGAALISPSGSGTDWTPGTGTGAVSVQPNSYVGLLVCSANCNSAYGQTWVPATSLGGGGGGSGTVTNIATTGPITGGPITTTGTIACPTCGVTGSPLSQFAATTSAQLASIISDETGSGSAVFATSPVLAGTPTAPTATAGTNTTQLATTAFVGAATVANVGNSSSTLNGIRQANTGSADTAATSPQLVTALNASPTTKLSPLLESNSGSAVLRPFYFQAQGDSVMASFGATQIGTGQFAILSNDAPSMTQPLNYGVGGTTAPQIASNTFANWIPHPTYPSAMILDGGNNDYNSDTCGKVAGTNCVKNFSMAMEAAAAWAANAPQNRLFASQCTQSGGAWTTNSNFPINAMSGGTAGNALQSVVSGAILTCNIPSTNSGHIELFQSTTNAQTGTYTVGIGPVGSPVLQTDAECSGTTTISSGPCGGTALASSPSPQRHEWFNAAWAGQALQVVITTTNAATNAIVGVGYNTTTPAANLNAVAMENTMPVAAFDATGIYSAAVGASAAKLAAFGYKVFLADIRTAMAALPGNGVSGTTTTTCVGTTFTNHPNDCAYAVIAQTVETAAAAAGVQFWQYNIGGQNVGNYGYLNAPLQVPSCSTSASNATCTNTLNRNSQIANSVLLNFFANAGVHWGKASLMPDGTTNQYYMSFWGNPGGGAYSCAEPPSTTPGTPYLQTGWAPTFCVKNADGSVNGNAPITVPQFIAKGTAPTIAAGAAAGTGPTVSVTSGANMAHRLSITTGTSTTASAVLATVTFSGTVSTAPQGCSLQPTNVNAIGQSGMVYPSYPTTTGYTISVGGAAIPASTVYTYSVICQ